MRTTIDTLVGQRVRWIWTEGPTEGMTHEHFFSPDGTVTFAKVGAGGKLEPPGHADRYAIERVSDSVRLVSYLAGSGYTLTVAMNFDDQSLVGFASNDKTWTLVRGKFEIVGAGAE